MRYLRCLRAVSAPLSSRCSNSSNFSNSPFGTVMRRLPPLAFVFAFSASAFLSLRNSMYVPYSGRSLSQSVRLGAGEGP